MESTVNATAARRITIGLVSLAALLGGEALAQSGVRSGQPRTNVTQSRRAAERAAAAQQNDPMPAPVVPTIPGPGGIVTSPVYPSLLPPYYTQFGDGIYGGGLTVNGQYSDDHFRLGFHLGTPRRVYYPPRVCYPDSRYYRRHYLYGGYPWYTSYYGYDPYYLGAVEGVYYGVDPRLLMPPPTRPAYTPPQQPPPPPAPITDLERGKLSLQSNDPERAVMAFRSHVSRNPKDAEALRLLGFALMDAGNLKEGVAMVGLAYREEPALADRPVAPDLFGAERKDLRRNVTRASIYANNVGTASSWLAMAALTQAEGRNDVALRMVERARTAGLDPAIADRMAAAVSN